MKKRVVIGLSGGVDSAVSAYLLLKQGYDVIAVFMENWDDILNNDVLGHKKQDFGCTSRQDYEDALKVANHLNIPLHKVNFVKEYWDSVFVEFLEEYKIGLTPNPDVLCNKFIKFGAFKKYVEQEFHPDFIATGHYAGTDIYNDEVRLLKAYDENKDQTYFLCNLSNHQLRNVIFPLQKYLKSEVREIAKEVKIPIWDKKDSTGICFIGERHFSEFLKNYLPNQPGNIVDIKTNNILGKHKGTMYYTIGQRSGLNLGGNDTRYFVCKKDNENKIIYVSSLNDEKEYLFTKFVKIKELNKINQEDWLNKNLKVRFRHRQKLIDCKVLKDENKDILIECIDEVKAITPGQYAVFYLDNVCLGGGVIESSYK